MPVFPPVGKTGVSDIGIIMYDISGTKQTIPYSAKALVECCSPKNGDQVKYRAMVKCIHLEGITTDLYFQFRLKVQDEAKSLNDVQLGIDI